MLVSIIIPAYNAELFLEATVHSVKVQAFQDWELVIFDDGSKDGTYPLACRLAEGDDRIRVVHHANVGMAAARNAGFRACSPTSSFLLFLDSDDLLEPDALAVLVEVLENDHEAIAAHGKSRCIDLEGRPLAASGREERSWRYSVQNNRLVSEPPANCTGFRHLVAGNVILTPGLILIRRTIFEAVGDFDQTIFLAADWDMWLRLGRYGDFVRVDQITLAYRLHPFNSSNKVKQMRQHEQGCTRKAYHSAENTPEQRRIVAIGYRASQMRYFRSKLEIATERLRAGRPDQALLQYAYGLRHFVRSRQNF